MTLCNFLLGLTLSVAGLVHAAEVQPLDINLLDDGAKPAAAGRHSGVDLATSLELELSQHIRLASGANLARLGLDATAGLALQPSESLRIRLGVRAVVRRLHGRTPTGGARRSSLEVDEAYLRQRLTQNLSLTFGRQIIAWGQSDFYYGAQLTDVVNPRDFTEPALVDVDESRLPVLASRLHWRGALEWDLVATHERRYHRFDRAGGDFDPYRPLRDADIRLDEGSRGTSALNDWFLRVGTQIGSGDLAVVGGRTRSNSPVAIASSSPDQPALDLQHPAHTLAGISLNRALGSAVFKTEQVWSFGKALGLSAPLPQPDFSGTIGPHARDTLQSMVGVDYFGFADWLLTAELSNEHVRRHSPQLAQPRNAGNLSLLARWTPAGRDLELNALVLTAFPYTARVARLETALRLSDHFRLRLGAIWYQVDDARSFYAPFEHQDRIYSSIEFSL